MRIKTPNGVLEGDTITEIIKKHGKDCLYGADLRYANLHGASLRDADFDGARNIPPINTTQAHLTIPLSKTDVQRIRRECNRILKQLEKENQ